MKPHREYTFSVINFTKSDSLFNYGMLPAVYSMAANSQKADIEKGWRRSGSQVSYKKGRLLRENSRRYYYSFPYSF
jgi:hypothetical protein